MKRILCLGDSNTWGFDPRSPFGSRYPEDVRWTGLLTGRGFEVLNRGENGMRVPTESRLPALAGLVRRSLPLAFVLVMLGTNDLLGGCTAGEAAGRMARLIPALLPEAEAARLILLSPPPLAPGAWVQGEAVLRESRSLAGLYRALAEKNGIGFADTAEWNLTLAFDGVHLLPEGHRAMAGRLSDLLGAPGAG